jgi:hypothetical protein
MNNGEKREETEKEKEMGMRDGENTEEDESDQR